MATSATAELDEDLNLDTETPTAMDTDGTNIDKSGKVFVYSYKYLVTNYKTAFAFIN
jgi:hypothetical protein